MTGFVLRSAVQNSIMVSNPGSLGNTIECQEYCQRDGLDCPAFSVNYQNMRCDKLDRNSQGRTQDLIPRDGENYFEKICLRGKMRTCAVRHIGFVAKYLHNVFEGKLWTKSEIENVYSKLKYSRQIFVSLHVIRIKCFGYNRCFKNITPIKNKIEKKKKNFVAYYFLMYL